MGFAETFKALSDPVRRDILILLKNGKKLSAGEIASHFDISGATISRSEEHTSELQSPY